jgi:hypothetical protein
MKPLFNIKAWLATFLPAAVIIFFGLFEFRDAVLHSVQLSPHPQIIYLIGLGYVTGLVALGLALQRCLAERDTLLAWSDSNKAGAARMVPDSTILRSISPLLVVLGSFQTRSPKTQQEILEKEVDEFDKAIHQGLNFPAYISGALIGLGLVGTFIGLLGSLQEMAEIISSMMDSTGSGQSSFSQMLGKLKRPMEGMGTAFVASMYGLMGSLLLEWMLMSIRKVCNQILLTVRQAIREQEIASASADLLDGGANPNTGVTAERYIGIARELLGNQRKLTGLLDKHQEVQQSLLKAQDQCVTAEIFESTAAQFQANQQLLTGMLEKQQEVQQCLLNAEAQNVKADQFEAISGQLQANQHALAGMLEKQQEVQQFLLNAEAQNVKADHFQAVSDALQANQGLLAGLLDKQQEVQQTLLQSRDEYANAIAARAVLDKTTQELLASILEVSRETLQVQSASKQQAQEISLHLATQFAQLAAHTQQLNAQVFTLSKLYQDLLKKHSALARIRTSVKGISLAVSKIFTRKKS